MIEKFISRAGFAGGWNDCLLQLKSNGFISESDFERLLEFITYKLHPWMEKDNEIQTPSLREYFNEIKERGA